MQRAPFYPTGNETPNLLDIYVNVLGMTCGWWQVMPLCNEAFQRADPGHASRPFSVGSIREQPSSGEWDTSATRAIGGTLEAASTQIYKMIGSAMIQ